MMHQRTSYTLVAALPTYYMFYSRYGTRSSQLAWVAGELLPLFIAAAAFFEGSLIALAPAYLVARLAFVSVYEIGYLQNDVVTVKRERGVQSRLHASDHQFFGERYRRIIAIKTSIVLAALALLSWLDQALALGLNLRAYAACLAVTAVAFAIHNRVRGRGNIITILVLLCLKYGAPLLLVANPSADLAALGAALVMFPLAGAIEYAGKPRFGIRWAMYINQDIDTFRVAYYLTVAAAALVAWAAIPGLAIPPALAATVLYLLLYRTACLYMVRRRGYRRFLRTRSKRGQEG